MMISGIRHLNSRDKRALAIFFGIALMCALYFASGILVTYVSSPSGEMEMAKEGTGFTVRVLGLQTFAAAEQLSTALREQRRVNTAIDAIPADQGYLLKIGPLVRREDAEMLTSELQNSGFGIVKIVENCQDCDQPRSGSISPPSTQRKPTQ